MTKVVGWLACVGAVLLLVVAMVSGVTSVRADAATPGAKDLHVETPWVRLPAVPGRPGAGYLTLHAGNAAAELVGVTSPVARVEMHSMSMAGGVMKMAKLPALPVAAGGKAALAPGGNHLMLFDLAASVKPGTAIPLTLRFADGRTLDVAARGQAAATAAPAPAHSAH